MQEKMKKITGVLLTMCMTFSMMSCFGGSTGDDSSSDKNSSSTLDTTSGDSSTGTSDKDILKQYVGTKEFVLFADRGPKLTDNAMKMYADCGFTTLLLTEDYTTFTDSAGNLTTGYKGAFKTAENLGMKVLARNHYNDPDYFSNTDADRQRTTVFGVNYKLPARNITNEFKEFNNFQGFYMWDEPRITAIDSIMPLVNWYNASDYKDKLFHVNLFPEYAGIERIGEATTKTYFKKYVDTILSAVEGEKTLCVDNYPLVTSKVDGNYIRSTYLQDIMNVAVLARDYNLQENKKSAITPAICIQAFKDTGLRDIECQADIEFQINMGLAVGVKMYEYFLYTSLDTMVGITNLDGTVRGNGDLYKWVKEANKKVKGMNIILDYTWEGLYTSYGTDAEKQNGSFVKIEENALTKLNGIKSLTSRFDAVCGQYKKDGKNAYMITNFSEPTKNTSNYVDLEFENDTTKVVVVTNGISSVKTIENNKLSLQLKAGQGAFVIPVE